MSNDIEKLYYNPRFGFSGINNLTRKAKERKINSKQIKQFLVKQVPYSLHKPIRKQFERQRVYVHHIGDQWQADLVEMIPYSRHNDDYNYILMVIDVFSKYAWAFPLKTKRPTEVKHAFDSILKSGKKPKALQTDDGKEFFGKETRQYFKEKDINHFSSKSDKKASVVERLNRTIKEKMWRYFTAVNNYRWIDVLKDLVHNYNNSFHRSIKMKPIEVTKDNETTVWKNLYETKTKTKTKKPLFSIGDVVRISKYKRRLFDKGYTPNWTQEVFLISKVYDTFPTTYDITDTNGETIIGKFYEPELQKVEKEKAYIIERVIRHRTRNGVKQHLVKWKDYPDSQNSWVNETSFV